MTFDPEEVRPDFPILGQKTPLIYFDSAASALKPRPVIEALSRFYLEEYGTVHRAIYSQASLATEAYHNARRSVQRFIGASLAEEVIFTSGTTASLNLVARSFSSLLKPGDAIILSQIEHHSNLIPWQMVAKEKDLELRFVPVDERGELLLEEFELLLDEKVKLVSLAHISNTLGTVHPIETIIEKAHAVGARVCIDGAQAIAHLPIDVSALDVDFYAFSGHKLYGPTGVGVLYGKKELLEAMPPLFGGGDMIGEVSLLESTTAPLPLKFEAGTPPIAQVIALAKAIEYLSLLDLTLIYQHEKKLQRAAVEGLLKIPEVRFLGAPSFESTLFSFSLEGMHALDVTTLLDGKGIALRSGHHCSQTTLERFGVQSVMRLSFGLYNTLEEVEQFLCAIQEALSFKLSF